MDEFDEFYVATRRRLLLQTLALTGDLATSRAAVRDTFVVARHHWRKVSRLEDPESWVRPRAWARAQRRAAGRMWHRNRDLTEQQRAVLAGLQRLPDAQRKALLLTHLTALSLPGIGREINQPADRAAELLQQATASLSLALGCDSALLRGEIESLAPLVARPGLPRATVIRRSGRRRRRLHAVAGSAIAIALVAAAGAFVQAQPPPERPRLTSAPTHPVSPAMLLQADQAPPVHRQWTVTKTGDNTRGDGINTICQAARYADPRGRAGFVRTMVTDGGRARELVQSVEVSASPGAAVRTYRTTLGWYAGCRHARVQLTGSYRVLGLGDHAQALTLSLPGRHRQSYVVTIARTGAVTDTTVLRTEGPGAPELRPALTAAAVGLENLCASSAAGRCGVVLRPRWQDALPPPSGETAGMLATVDLPPVGRIDDAWFGTDPASGGRNPAQTPCDRTDFASAKSTRSRTFLIPQAKLPDRFGISETYGRFADAERAEAFAARIRRSMRTCEHRQLGSNVNHHLARPHGPDGSSYSLWRVSTEINKSRSVSYWMGVAVAGRYVAQVSLAPTRRADVDQHTFARLVERARDRLFELPGSAT